MKNHRKCSQNRTALITLSTVLFWVFQSYGQGFQIAWSMDRTLDGASSSSNFIPHEAHLSGAHPHSLPNLEYLSLGGGDYAYGTTYWHNTGAEKYLEFSFSVSTFEYDLNAISFRVRRSGDGPSNVILRSSANGFASDLSNDQLSTGSLFYDFGASPQYKNLSGGLTFRLYGNNANSFQGVIYFDQIVISGNITSFVLPVVLTYFNTAPGEKGVNLSWETSAEKNSQAFVVERSVDLIKFFEIGMVEAAGEAHARSQYSFVDQQPAVGANYYRLKMVDQDHNFSYSVTRDFIKFSDFLLFNICPNPVSRNRIRIQTNHVHIPSLILTDISGQNIPFDRVDSEVGFVSLYPQNQLSAGIYILSLYQRGEKVHAKVLVP